MVGEVKKEAQGLCSRKSQRLLWTAAASDNPPVPTAVRYADHRWRCEW